MIHLKKDWTMPINRRTKSRAKAKRIINPRSQRTLAGDITASEQLIEIARAARQHGPMRLRLADGQIITVTSDARAQKPTSQTASATTSLRQIMLASPLADIEFDRPKELSPVRDVDL